jgi:putative hemolysin
MPLVADLVVLFSLTLVNAVFSAAEIAVVSVRGSRLRELADQQLSSARAALALRSNPEQFLATVQIGITVASTTAAAFGGSKIAEPLAVALRRFGAGDWAEAAAFAAVVSLVAFLSIVLGELVPKSLALRASERYALLVARPLLSLSRLTRPIGWFMAAASNVVLRPLHDRTNFVETRMSSGELQQVVEEATSRGSLHPRAGEIASRAIDLGELRVSAVMVPRTAIIWLHADATREQVSAVLKSSAHTRFPVLGATEQDIAGYVLAHDLYQQLLAQTFDIKAALRKLPYFPERIAAVDALRELQTRRSKIAIIVDDYGAVAGLVSTEDIAEELVGEMLTEYDRPSGNIRAESEDSFLVNGATQVHDLNRELELQLPAGPDWSTIAGLVIATLNAIPRPGQRVAIENEVELETLEADARGIKLLRLRRLGTRAGRS